MNKYMEVAVEELRPNPWDPNRMTDAEYNVYRAEVERL